MFEHRESLAHETAKNALLEWLITQPEVDDYYSYPIKGGDRLWWRPNCWSPALAEYPFTKDGEGMYPIWAEIFDFIDNEELLSKWESPTYQMCIDQGYIPKYIADIVLIHKGSISTVIEVVHKNLLKEEKSNFYYKIGVSNVYQVSSSWILNQCKKPEVLELERIPNGEED